MTKEEAWEFAEHWIAAWNAHDLDAIISHYDESVESTSPVAARFLGLTGGKVVGKANLRAYFQQGLAAYPNLHFTLNEVFWGVNSVVLRYTDQNGTTAAEFLEFSPGKKVLRIVANYNV